MSLSVHVISGTTFTKPYIDCVEDWLFFWRESSSERVKFIPKLLGVRAEDDGLDANEVKYTDMSVVTLPEGEVSGSQMVRIVAAAFSEADFALLTDIDMLPLRPSYFSKIVEFASENNSDFLVARDVLGPDQYPMCYTVIRPSKLRLELEKLGLMRKDLKSTLWAVLTYTKKSELQSKVNKKQDSWYSDQRLLRELIDSNEASGGKVSRLDDASLAFRRLDRLYHNALLSWLWGRLDRRSYFVDYHVHLNPRTRSRVLKFLRENRGLGAV